MQNRYEYKVVSDQKVVEYCSCFYGNHKRMDTARILVREGTWWFGEERKEVPPLDEPWTVGASPKYAYWFCPTDHPFVFKRVRFGLCSKDFAPLSPRKKRIAAAFIWEREWDSSLNLGVANLQMIFPYLDNEIQEWVKEELGDPFEHRYDGHYARHLPADRLSVLEEKLGRPSGYGVRPQATWRTV